MLSEFRYRRHVPQKSVSTPSGRVAYWLDKGFKKMDEENPDSYENESAVGLYSDVPSIIEFTGFAKQRVYRGVKELYQEPTKGKGTECATAPDKGMDD